MLKNKADKYLILTLTVPLLYCVLYLIQGEFLLKGNSDAIDHQIPFFMAINDAISTDIIPSWTNYIFTGYSLTGFSIWQWYPPNWVSFVAPKNYVPLTMTVVAWLHFIGVAWAAFLYLREISKSSYWASVSAIAYTFSLPVMYGLATVVSQLPVHLFTLLSLYVIHTKGYRPWKLTVIYLAITTFATITGGFIQFAFYSIPLVFFYTIFIGFFGTETNTKDKKIILYCLGGIILGVVLSAPMLLPLLATSADTSRDHLGASPADIYHFIKISPILLWRLFSPNAFGHSILLPNPSMGGVNYAESMNAFCGVIMLFIAGYTITAWRSPIVIFWLAIFVGIILVTMTPLIYLHIALFGSKPIFNRVTILLPLVITSLAAIGGRYIDSKNQISLKKVILNPFWVLLMIAAAYGIPKGYYLIAEIFRGLLFICVLVLCGYYLCKKNKIVWHLIIFSVVLIEVVWSGHMMTTAQDYPLMVKPKDYYTYGDPKAFPPQIKSYLDQYRVVVSETKDNTTNNPGAREANQGMVYGYMSPWGYRSAFSSRLAFLLNKLSGMDASGTASGHLVCFKTGPRYERLADLTSVGFVVDPDAEWRVVEDRRGTCLPRASLFYEYETFIRVFKQNPQRISGLVGYWKFDGNTEDSSGNNNHGEWVGDESYSSDGVSGKAASFDGNSSYVTVSHSPSINVGEGAFSFGAWVKSYGHIGKNQHFLNKRTGGHQGLFWDLVLSPLAENINAEIAGHSFGNPPSNMELYKWHHVMFTRDHSGIVTVYIDGKFLKSKTMPGDSSNTHTFNIGNLQGSLDQGFSGLIDDVVIYNRSLSKEEVCMISGGDAKELAVERLKEPDFPIKRKVVLTSKFHASLGPPGPDSSVKFIENGNSHIVIDVKTKTPAILLLTDNFAKGWTAQVDGKEVEIMEGDIAFRAVYIPAGVHNVKFKYHPPMLRLSLLFSLVGIFICAALYIKRNK